MKSHARLYGISTIAIPKICFAPDRMNWQETVKSLRDILAYSNIRLVVCPLEENGVHALSSEENPDFYAEDKIEKYNEEFYSSVRDLETDFT